jgi:DMSO/TMAO reductase YedYZ molybdopterin-dependent catalytic subunit
MADMAGRRTNLALLALLALALATGGLAFAVGTAWVAPAMVAHGAAALGIVLLAPGKSVIARRGFRRHAGTSSSAASILFAVLVAVALATGVGHATGLLRTIGGPTAMQVHVTAALAAIPLGVWHVAARRVRPRRTDLSRRTLLRSGALVAGSLAAYGALAGVVSALRLPGTQRRFTGSYATGSLRPEDMPVTQWLNDRVPGIDARSWKLSVSTNGVEVARYSLEDLDVLREPIRATIDCTGGWYAEQDWEGVRLDRLFAAEAGGEVDSISARSITGYARRYPFGDAGRLWVATRAAGSPLSPGHGYPARLVAPGRRGFWWVKWVIALNLSRTPWWWQPPFPLT